MAASAQKSLARGPIGKNRFEIGKVTIGAGGGAVYTKLRNIYKVEGVSVGVADQSYTVYKNASVTGTEDVAGSFGAFFLATTGAGEFRYLVIGR
jgi:hypothetical protein